MRTWGRNMLRVVSSLLCGVLLSCDLKSPVNGEVGDTSGDGEEEGHGSGSAGEHGTDDSSPPDCADLPETPLDQACDVALQDCPDCYRCTWQKPDGVRATNSEPAVCVPVPLEPKGLGESCTAGGGPHNDDCQSGSFCYDVGIEGFVSVCRPFCELYEFTCEDPTMYCLGSSSTGGFVCLPQCDPLVQDCRTHELCIPVDYGIAGYACIPDSDVPEDKVGPGEPCEFINACVPASRCVPQEILGPGCPDANCCTPYCDTRASDPDAVCQAVNPDHVCLSGCETGDIRSPVHVGICGVVIDVDPGVCPPDDVDPVYPWCSEHNADHCPGDSFGYGDSEKTYCWCSLPCENDGDCPLAASGTTTPRCDLGMGDVCVLPCDGGETCPLGMECGSGWSSPICMWPGPGL